MGKVIEVDCVYTGDSTNYHIFQVVGGGEYVGSIYIKKKSENNIPKTVEVNFVTPTSDKTVWLKGIKSLIDGARDGSKAEQKLKKVMKDNK
jgi:hypothetical protein